MCLYAVIITLLLDGVCLSFVILANTLASSMDFVDPALGASSAFVFVVLQRFTEFVFTTFALLVQFVTVLVHVAKGVFELTDRCVNLVNMVDKGHYSTPTGMRTIKLDHDGVVGL